MEVKKSPQASLENKRITFFLLGLICVLSVLFVGLQYNSTPSSYDIDSDLLEDLSQDLEYTPRTDQKDMVSAEAATPPTKAITQEVKADQKPQQIEQQISSTTSKMVIGDGQGAVEGAEIKEAVPETPIEETEQKGATAEQPLHFRVVQKIPEFPGGWSAYMQWLTNNLKYPAAAKNEKKQGTVIVSFVINTDGTVTEVKLVQSASPVLDREALGVMRKMPKWKPGMDHDKVCRTMIAVPIVFNL